MAAFFEVLGWLFLATSCLSSLVSALLKVMKSADNAHMRSAAWAIAAALFFIAARMPAS